MTKPLGSHKIVALIPARAGSKRVPGKNTRLLAGAPLLYYSIEPALACDLFSAIVVSTDCEQATRMARALGCEVHERNPAHATDTASDFLWVRDVMEGREEEIFCILRPTSPFRTASTIRRAYALLIGSGAHSVRAVEPVTQHPGKMWVDDGRMIRPLLNETHPDGTPWHSSPTQLLPKVYAQNASLEMAWTWVLQATKTISGVRVAPFFTDAREGFNIDTPEDFAEAERIASELAQSPL